jgi:hypothetical protein
MKRYHTRQHTCPETTYSFLDLRENFLKLPVDPTLASSLLAFLLKEILLELIFPFNLARLDRLFGVEVSVGVEANSLVSSGFGQPGETGGEDTGVSSPSLTGVMSDYLSSASSFEGRLSGKSSAS